MVTAEGVRSFATLLASTSETSEAAEEELSPFVISALLLFVLIMMLGLHAFSLLERYLGAIPESVFIIALGAIVGGFVELIDVTTSLDPWTHLKFSPHMFFILILPPIIFDSGYKIPDAFFKNLGAILVFAVFGTIISTAVVGGVLAALAGTTTVLPAGLGFSDSMAFGALISAVDPVATLAIFQTLNADPTLYALVFGESLLNDAIAITLFRTFNAFEGSTFEMALLGKMVSEFLISSFASIGIGLGVGIVTALIFKHCRLARHAALELGVFYVLAFQSYMICEGLHFSGIMGLLVTAIINNRFVRPSLSARTLIITCNVNHALAFSMESLVFLYLGMCLWSSTLVWNSPLLFITLAGILVGRALNVFPLTALINAVRRRHGRRIPWKFAVIQFYSGLRGAIAFALSLGVASTEGPVLVTTALVITLLTIIVFGTSTGPIMRALKLKSPSAAAELSGGQSGSSSQATGTAAATAHAPVARGMTGTAHMGVASVAAGTRSGRSSVPGSNPGYASRVSFSDLPGSAETEQLEQAVRRALDLRTQTGRTTGLDHAPTTDLDHAISHLRACEDDDCARALAAAAMLDANALDGLYLPQMGAVLHTRASAPNTSVDEEEYSSVEHVVAGWDGAELTATGSRMGGRSGSLESARTSEPGTPADGVFQRRHHKETAMGWFENHVLRPFLVRGAHFHRDHAEEASPAVPAAVAKSDFARTASALAALDRYAQLREVSSYTALDLGAHNSLHGADPLMGASAVPATVDAEEIARLFMHMPTRHFDVLDEAPPRHAGRASVPASGHASVDGSVLPELCSPACSSDSDVPSSGDDVDGLPLWDRLAFMHYFTVHAGSRLDVRAVRAALRRRRRAVRSGRCPFECAEGQNLTFNVRDYLEHLTDLDPQRLALAERVHAQSVLRQPEPERKAEHMSAGDFFGPELGVAARVAIPPRQHTYIDGEVAAEGTPLEVVAASHDEVPLLINPAYETASRTSLPALSPSPPLRTSDRRRQVGRWLRRHLSRPAGETFDVQATITRGRLGLGALPMPGPEPAVGADFGAAVRSQLADAVRDRRRGRRSARSSIDE